MKALSLHQPWATLVAIAGKHETRSWSTDYRGALLICSTQSSPGAAFAKATTDPKIYERVRHGQAIHGHIGYPHGVALVVVELVDCVEAEAWIARENDAETGGRSWEIQAQRDMGDLSPGRFVWVFGKRKLVLPAVPAKGRQKLWTPSSELQAQVMQNAFCRTEGA